MIFAAHQPNFIPYMGLFYKIYMSDMFAFSDNVLFSRREYHNYNYIWENGERSKITLPVDRHSGIINEVRIASPEENLPKLLKRIETVYHRQKYFDDVFPMLKKDFLCGFERMTYLNTTLIMDICRYLGINTKVLFESDVCQPSGNASEQIIHLCKCMNCSDYLSGSGAVKYLDENLLKENGINVIWSNYQTLEYGSLPDLSVIDYLMKCGNKLPEKWIEDKEKINGR